LKRGQTIKSREPILIKRKFEKGINLGGKRGLKEAQAGKWAD